MRDIKAAARAAYLGPLGRATHLAMRAASPFVRGLMVYGYRDKVSGLFRKRTRISNLAVLMTRKQIAVGDNVWVGHYTVIDGSNDVTIGEGVQISFSCGIFTHSSHISARLYGRKYIEIPREERKGYVRGPVVIGPYTCICAGAIILPGVTIGRGALIAAGAVVAHDVPDFGIARGSPARCSGDTRRLDAKYLRDPDIAESYFAPDAVASRMQLAQHA